MVGGVWSTQFCPTAFCSFGFLSISSQDPSCLAYPLVVLYEPRSQMQVPKVGGSSLTWSQILINPLGSPTENGSSMLFVPLGGLLQG